VTNDLFERKKPKPMVTLQLTTMVDLVTILILYLLVSTVFGVSDLTLPPDLQLPKSLSKETIDSAPQILISKGTVQFSATQKIISVADFASGSGSALKYLSDIKGEYVSQKQRMGKKPVLLSLVADKKEKYSVIFSVVAQIKRTGFDTVLFVAAGGE
jgi:biopolymer transport protein ExbD